MTMENGFISGVYFFSMCKITIRKPEEGFS